MSTHPTSRFPRAVAPAAILWTLASAGCMKEAAPDFAALAEPSPQVRLFAAPGTVRADEVTLVWSKPADAGPGTMYEVTCDGRFAGSTAKNYFTVKDLEPLRWHAFAVGARLGTGAFPRTSNTVRVVTAAKAQVVSVLDHGAKGDGVTLDTAAIQAAINACPPQGIVSIPRGEFLSGALFLKGGMTLHIAAGGVLKGSASPAHYEPFIRNRFEGWESDTYASLLNAGALDRHGPAKVRNLRICGEGRIVGGSTPLGNAMTSAHGQRSRGRLICLMNCADVEIEGLALEGAPAWAVHYIYSANVTCRGLTINNITRSGDGIDPDSSVNSFILGCNFATTEDCIGIKSGKNPEGNAVNRPSENIFIMDCRFTRGDGISIGSEMSGGVRRVLIQDCAASGLRHGLQIKGTKERGGFIEDVTVRDCDLEMVNILSSLGYNNDGAPAPVQPRFRNFRFINLDLTKARTGAPVIVVNGFPNPGHETQDVLFQNIKLPAGAVIRVDEARDVGFANVTTADGRGPVYDVKNSERVTY